MLYDRRVVLVRHPAVAEEYRGVCYGRTDVPLSLAGVAALPDLLDQLQAFQPTHIVHSDTQRTRWILQAFPQAQSDRRLQERHFGTWEGRPWDDIYADVGDAMNGLITAPASYAPPGGETTFQLRDRVVDWYGNLPTTGTIVAVTHGGPIGCLRGHLIGCPVPEWLKLVPAVGEVIVLDQSRAAATNNTTVWET